MTHKSILISLICAIALTAATYSCNNSHTPSPLSSDELAIINGPDVMRVLTVYNPDDSIVLRTPCVNFCNNDLKSDSYQTLARKMIATVTDPTQDGVGIAGPQIGINRRIVAVMRYDKEGHPFEVYPNIYISHLSDSTRVGSEGCLSVPGKRGQVNRAAQIVISYTDPSTLATVSDTIDGFSAVIFQHEVDHLDGILYTDKLI